MLRELKNRQPDENLNRRWFSDSFFDLIVWEDKQGDIIKFELCYDKNKNEHSYTWAANNGHTHLKVDDGEIYGRHKMSPILVPDGHFDNKLVTNKFFKAHYRLKQRFSGKYYITRFFCSKGILYT